MTEKLCQRPIECSRPHYRRNLLLAALVFSALLFVNLLVFGHLIFRDLGNRMRKEAISGASARAIQIAQKLSEEGLIDLFRVHQRITVFSEYVKQVLTREHYVNTVTIYDDAGRTVRLWTQKGG